MTYTILDQGDDGWTIENNDLPNVIGWGETYDDAVADLNDQTDAIIVAVGYAQGQLDVIDELNRI
jgi:predicted RNase H-like HicB family nuclease